MTNLSDRLDAVVTTAEDDGQKFHEIVHGVKMQ